MYYIMKGIIIFSGRDKSLCLIKINDFRKVSNGQTDYICVYSGYISLLFLLFYSHVQKIICL